MNGIKNEEISEKFGDFDYFFIKPNSDSTRLLDTYLRKCIEELLFSMQLKTLGQQKVNKLRFIEWPKRSRLKFKRMNRYDLYLFFLIELIGLIVREQEINSLIKFPKRIDKFAATEKFLTSLLEINMLAIKSLNKGFNYEAEYLRKKHTRTRSWLGKEGFICTRITLQGSIYLDYQISDHIFLNGRKVKRIEPSYDNCFPIPLTSETDEFFKSAIGVGQIKPGHIQVKVSFKERILPFIKLKISSSLKI